MLRKYQLDRYPVWKYVSTDYIIVQSGNFINRHSINRRAVGINLIYNVEYGQTRHVGIYHIHKFRVYKYAMYMYKGTFFVGV